MPRYYFDVHDGKDIIDDTGTELPDMAAAKRAAAELSGRLLADEPETFWDAAVWRVDVHEAEGTVLFTLTFTGSVPGKGAS